jgi:uncharacterized protein
MLEAPDLSDDGSSRVSRRGLKAGPRNRPHVAASRVMCKIIGTSGEGATRVTEETIRLRRRLIANMDRVLALTLHYEVHDVAIVGSLARGTANSHSDFDLLFTAGDQTTLLDLVALRASLERLLEGSVDLIDRDSLTIGREHFEEEAVPLWMLIPS